MNTLWYKLNKTTCSLHNLFSARTAALIVTISISLAATTATAEWRDEPIEAAYVDSIHKWGAWELDIEPAAGGIQPAATQALNARDTRVTLRTNSISALAPTAPAPATFNPPAPVVPPVVPVTPPMPPVTPAIPPRIGGPAGGLY